MPPKRKSSQTDGAGDGDVQPRRSTRRRTSTAQAREAAASESAAPQKQAKKPAAVKKAAPKAGRKGKQGDDNEDDADRQAAPPPAGGEVGSKANGAKAVKTPSKSAAAETKPKDAKDQGRQYWLMKAEPESRIENGVDVRFSIDDLAAKKEPEPWDGMHSHSLFPIRVHIQVHVRTDRRSVTGIRNFVGMDFSTRFEVVR